MKTAYIFTLFLIASLVKAGDKQDTLNLIFQQHNFEINILSSGCFHSTAEKYLFLKEDSTFIAEWYQWNQKTDWALKYKVRLSKRDMDVLKNILAKGLKLSRGGCTTSNTYQIKGGTHNLEFKDNTCNYEGLDHWRARMGGSEKLD